MTDKKKDQSLGGFAKKTNFKWLGVGVIIFTLLALMPTPESMVSKAESDKETRETEKKVMVSGKGDRVQRNTIQKRSYARCS